MNHKRGVTPFFAFLFGCLLFSQILYSESPKEINFTLLFHVASLAGLLVLGTLKKILIEKRFKIHQWAIIPLMFVCYFYSIGVFVSYYNGAGFLRIIEFPYRIANLMIIIILPSLVRDEKDLNRIFFLLILMVGLLLLRDLVFWSTAHEKLRMVGRGFSPLSIVAAIPFAIGGLIAYWENSKHRLFIRLFLLVFCLLAIVKVFFSFSRSVWIMNIPMTLLGVYYLLNKTHRRNMSLQRLKKRLVKTFICFTFLGLAGGILVVHNKPDIRNMIYERIEGVPNYVNMKMDEYNNAFNVWLKNPVFGIGFGVESTFYKGNRLREQDYVHNWMLQFLQSSGLIGLCLVLAMLAQIFFNLVRLWKQTSRTMLQTGILATCFLIILNIVLQGLIQTSLQKQEIYFLISMVISLTIIIRKLDNARYSIHSRIE